ncbi:MAG: NUDIX hydrolase [Rhodovibrionaceae bacterium]|nr:NUDIX hydrolase [Rhodovibrionaceae bacterium]
MRPVDAAGIVLLRIPRRGQAEVLLGRRHANSGFMPDIYVFPGGRVERADAKATGFAEAPPQPPGPLDKSTRRRLPILARAALRETWEETGLLLGTPGPPPDLADVSALPAWRAFRAAGLTPAFSSLYLVARAITPTDSPLRFHTRFFAADGALAEGALSGDGELEDIGWVRIGETANLPMAGVSRFVLREALDRRHAPHSPAALYCYRRSCAHIQNAVSVASDFPG